MRERSSLLSGVSDRLRQRDRERLDYISRNAAYTQEELLGSMMDDDSGFDDFLNSLDVGPVPSDPASLGPSTNPEMETLMDAVRRTGRYGRHDEF